jgi:protein TonB
MDQPNLTETLLSRRKSLDFFAVMLVISLLLHLCLSVFVLIPARTTVLGSHPLYVDLKSFSAPASPTSKPAEAAKPAPPDTPTPLPGADLPEQPTAVDQLQRDVAKSLQEAAQAPEAVHQSSIGLGITAGYFGSFAEGETLRSEIREYYFTLMRRINEVWWTHSTSLPAVRAAAFAILINREGKVVACHLMESSGNPQYDQLLQESVKLAEPLPPLPASFVGDIFNAPIRFVPPLNLMHPGFLSKPSTPHL